jgi:hypothetical protein
MIAGTSRVGGIGPQHYAAYPGTMTATPTQGCDHDCETAALTATATAVEAGLPSATQINKGNRSPDRTTS